jgi:LPXTG-motif cell wall-anchored protein
MSYDQGTAMNTTTIIIILVVLLVLGGGWGFSRRGRL